MPFAAIWGLNTNEAMFAVLIGAAGVMMAWVLLHRLGLPTEECIWLTVFFGAGTIFWYYCGLPDWRWHKRANDKLSV